MIEFLHLTQAIGPFVFGEVVGVTETERIAAADKTESAHQHFSLRIAQLESRLAHGSLF